MPRIVGRYTLYDELAAGGMATVHFARMRGEGGFSRMVAVKTLHAQYAREEAFRAMFLDEARLVSRIRHPNVVATLDVVEDGGELMLVMEYVHGETLSRLLRRIVSLGEKVPLDIAVAIVSDMLDGLHAAHEATSETGEPLHIVHRDVSPQNVLVAADGVAHVADFGIAKAVGRLAEKYSNQAAKGKAGYMPPEQMRGGGDRRADIYAAGIVLWETLVAERLFTGESFLEIVTKALDAPIPPPSSKRPEVSATLDAVVKRATARNPDERFATAREMVIALEAVCPRASGREVGLWVKRIASESLDARRAQIERIERGADEIAVAAAPPVREPVVETVSGLAPTRTNAPARSIAPWVSVAALVLAAGSMTVWQLRRPHEEKVAAPSPTPPTPVSVSASASASASSSASSEPVPIVTTVTSATPAVASSSPAHAAQRPTVTHAVSAAPPPQPSCRWVELPGPDGIMIPKKVCK